MPVEPQLIFNLVSGFALSVVGWFARELWGAVKKLQEDLHNIEVDLPKSYVSKNEFRDTMQRIESMVQKIFDKLDDKVDK